LNLGYTVLATHCTVHSLPVIKAKNVFQISLPSIQRGRQSKTAFITNILQKYCHEKWNNKYFSTDEHFSV